ncbi:hypothetical protein PaecuDRAFT_1680 [Paenibacillus curdlanolyticus YK9]|uniref:Uncharacterized protein n=1 Tax=Paenibacillus curdlanolyticus YK9 TaxID=717606 RepID=E0I7S9_9BACL|nr:hypothetical protein PaecuDRAFT_1680 [Paenibacillus curdlanolyticus YK9]
MNMNDLIQSAMVGIGVVGFVYTLLTVRLKKIQ